MWAVEKYPKRGVSKWDSIYQKEREAKARAEELSNDDSVKSACVYKVFIDVDQYAHAIKYKNGKLAKD